MTVISNPGPGLKFKSIEINRVLNSADGDVAYTGVGFKPRVIIAVCNGYGSIGVSSIVDEACVGMTYTPAPLTDYKIIYTYPSAAGNATAVVKSFDADGFTLTWTKGSTPAGTATIYCFCFG